MDLVTAAAFDPTDAINALSEFENTIIEQEGAGIRARWGFGHVLLQLRNDRKQLPPGLRDEICAKFRLGKTEISQRMQFAAQVPRDEVSACADTYGTWNRIKREVLPKKPKPGPKRPIIDNEAWARGIGSQLEKWLSEANGSDERHAALVAELWCALKAVTDEVGTPCAAA